MRLLVIVVLFSLGGTRAGKCQSNGTICINQNHFQQCLNVDGEYRLEGNGTACPDGTLCDHSSGTAICRKFARSPGLTELQSEADLSCSGPIKHPAASCYEYYECLPVWWWWEPELKTCPESQAFDVESACCLDERLVDCQSRSTSTSATTTTTTTTTPPPPVVVPECEGTSKHPALVCYQYIECVPVWWWWTPELKSCPQGQAYDRKAEKCVCAGLVNCELPDSEVRCDGPGTHPSLTCKDYYECTPFLWWWEPQLRKCPPGEVYDKSSCQCAVEEIAPCFDPVPKCQGFAKYPAAQKNQYYECVLNDSGSEWSPTLKTCNSGMVFLPSRGKCVLEWWPFHN